MLLGEFCFHKLLKKCSCFLKPRVGRNWLYFSSHLGQRKEPGYHRKKLKTAFNEFVEQFPRTVEELIHEAKVMISEIHEAKKWIPKIYERFKHMQRAEKQRLLGIIQVNQIIQRIYLQIIKPNSSCYNAPHPI